MKPYIAFFKLRFINGLQYKAAAIAGVLTQLSWGFMYIMIYDSFISQNSAASPMSFSQIVNYIWLQQAFLVIFMAWFLDNDLFDMISKGNVAYELTKPIDLYKMWYAKNCALRLSKVFLRAIPILLIVIALPNPYKLTFPKDVHTIILFLFSFVFGFLLVIAYVMLIYIATFYTISPMGARMVMVMLADFLSGGLIPLPLLPNYITKYIYYLPFASMANLPYRIFGGAFTVKESIYYILLQLFWLIVLVILGKLLMKKALLKVEVQGG